MLEEASSEAEVLVEELLEDIYSITLKIKRELDTINDLVRENGDFSIAVSKTNLTLLEMIKKRHIDLSFIKEDESENSNGNKGKSKNRSNDLKNK